MLKKLLLFGLLLWPLLNAKVVVFRTNDSYNDRIAAFGPRLPESEEGLEGFLINVEILPELAQTVEDTSLVFAQEEELSSYLPHQGCKERQAPVDLSNSSLRWIALVERGGCSFVQKTLVAQRMGASGIIVGDNEKNSGLITMYPPLDDNYEWKVDQITIPAVFVKQWTYRELVFLIRPGSVGFSGSANLGRTSASSFVSIEDGLKIRIVKSEDFQWPLLDIIIVTVIAPIVIIVFLYSLYRFRRTRQLQFHLQNQESEEDTLTQEELEQIPIIIYRAPSDSIEDGDGDENSPLIAESSDRKSVNWDTCVVCLELFEDGDELRLFQKTCRHRFHVKCIDTWLSLGKSSACPICKRSIRGDPQEEGDHTHDEEVVDIVLVPATPSEQSPSQNVPSITVTPSTLPSSTPQRSSSLRPSHVAVQIPSRVSTRILNASDMSASFHSSGAVTSASVDSNSSVMRLFGRSSTRRFNALSRGETIFALMIDKLWKIYTVSTPTEDPSVLHELFQSGYRKNDSILSVQHIPKESHTEYICETEKRTIHVLYFDKEGIALVGFLPTTCASDRIAFPWFARVLSYLQEGLELLPLAFDDEQLLDFAFNYGHSSYIELYLTFYVKEVHVGVEQIVFGFQSSDDHSKEDVLKHFHWATGIDIYRLRSYNSWIAPQLTRVKSADVLLGDKGNVKFYGEDVPKNLERFIRTIMKFA